MKEEYKPAGKEVFSDYNSKIDLEIRGPIFLEFGQQLTRISRIDHVSEIEEVSVLDGHEDVLAWQFNISDTEDNFTISETFFSEGEAKDRWNEIKKILR